MLIRILVIVGMIMQPLMVAASVSPQGSEMDACVVEMDLPTCCCMPTEPMRRGCECAAPQAPDTPQDSPAVPSQSVRDGVLAGLLLQPLVRIDLAQDVVHPQGAKSDPGSLSGDAHSIQSILCVWLT